MRREPSLTLRGALAILGHHEPRLIGKLDKLLGGLILTAGAGAGLAALGAPALAPLGIFAAMWGWVEQKNEAVRLLRQTLDAASGKIIATRGYGRRQLIAAAHTTIVSSAFFESFREQIDKNILEELQITGAEKERLVTGSWRHSGNRMLRLSTPPRFPSLPRRGDTKKTFSRLKSG